MIEETPIRAKRKRTKEVITQSAKTRRRKSGAAAEIDKRLAEAIRERVAVSKKLSDFAGLHDRFQRLTQEIQELLSMQSRMNAPVNAAMNTGPAMPLTMNTYSPEVPFIVGAPVPQGVGSIPARHPASNPEGNVADKIAGEGGFG